MAVELDRDSAPYDDGNAIETPRIPPSMGSQYDERGDTPTKVRLVLNLQQYPEHFRVAPELGNIPGVNEESSAGIIQALGPTSKTHNMQDKCRSGSVQLLSGDSQSLSCAPKAGGHPLPHYTERPAARDTRLKLEDVTLRSKMQAVTLNASRGTWGELTKLDDEVRSGATPSVCELILFPRSFADDCPNSPKRGQHLIRAISSQYSGAD
ncbi:hypothetical protein BC826DRAFT_1190385 [Russula brevipes]|nr:hypothetical protein BC826DRAFT_1190385 [Russula brevipes]